MEDDVFGWFNMVYYLVWCFCYNWLLLNIDIYFLFWMIIAGLEAARSDLAELGSPSAWIKGTPGQSLSDPHLIWSHGVGADCVWHSVLTHQPNGPRSRQDSLFTETIEEYLRDFQARVCTVAYMRYAGFHGWPGAVWPWQAHVTEIAEHMLCVDRTSNKASSFDTPMPPIRDGNCLPERTKAHRKERYLRSWPISMPTAWAAHAICWHKLVRSRSTCYLLEWIW